jgi:hypothetical protein
VARASDVAKQRDPVGGPADQVVESRLRTDRVGEEARPELRLQRLAERRVLGERERRYEFAESKRGMLDGSPPGP